MITYNEDTLWYNYDLADENMVSKLVKHLERICRASLEYELWAKDTKENDPNAITCPICEDNYYEKCSKCETHHHPQTLYNIVDEILYKYIDDNTLNSKRGLDIVREVMDLHTQRRVSFINLCVHCHKKYHQGHSDVMNKMYEIFKDRSQAGKEEMEKNVQEVEIELTEVTKDKLQNIPPAPIVKTYDIPKEEMLSPELPTQHLKKDLSNEQFVEDGDLTFISIDIND
jgi:hypothetical protein